MDLRRRRLEADLRRSRPEPRAAFLLELEERLAPRRRGASRRARLGLAAVVTAGLAGALAAFGGIGYAASGAEHAAQAIANAVQFDFSPHTVGAVSAASDQYGRVLLCHNGTEIEVAPQAVPAHLAQGDTFGKCPVYAPPIVPSAHSGGVVNLARSRENIVVVATKGGDHQITTGRGDDKVTTGSGNDVINAGKGNNVIKSGAGNDTIKSTGGHDTIFSGTGNDTIFVRDGSSDFVNCGPGIDIVYADPAKIDYVAANCEIVRRANFKKPTPKRRSRRR